MEQSVDKLVSTDRYKPSPVITYQLSDEERAAYNAKLGPIKEMPYRPLGRWEERRAIRKKKQAATNDQEHA